MMNRKSRALSLVTPWLQIMALSILAAGCTPRKYIYSVPEAGAVVAERLADDSPADREIPFTATAEMKEFAENAVVGSRMPLEKALALVNAMISRWNLDLEYDLYANMCAPDAFQAGRANCLSFTHLFVALSRAIGMKTVYVEVRDIEEYYTVDSAMLVTSGHICAGLYDGAEFFLVDFSPHPERTYRLYREIDDIEAISHHYNNLGYQAMIGDHSEEGLRNALMLFTAASRIKPDFLTSINNAGVVYSLLGDTAAAREKFEYIIALDPQMPEPYRNLAAWYLRAGDRSRAIEFMEHAARLKPANPHYRYSLGLILFLTGRLDDAERELRSAIKLNPAHEPSLLMMARLWETREEYAGALDYYTQAMALQDASPEAHRRYTGLLCRLSMLSQP